MYLQCPGCTKQHYCRSFLPAAVTLAVLIFLDSPTQLHISFDLSMVFLITALYIFFLYCKFACTVKSIVFLFKKNNNLSLKTLHHFTCEILQVHLIFPSVKLGAFIFYSNQL